jgi:uncharacterized OsmC-like protein
MHDRSYKAIPGSELAVRQQTLVESFARDPRRARVTKRVHTGPTDGRDPFHGTVVPENLARPDAPYGVAWPFGMDERVGGLHDAPNPGELLCGALAACADGTVRMIANRLGIELEQLEVEVTGEVDVRGALAVNPSVRAGFQRLRLDVRLRATSSTPGARLRQLAAAADRLCIVLDTLRAGVAVETVFATDAGEARADEPLRPGSRARR